MQEHEDVYPEDEPKSKSQLKRDMLALQELGEKITELSSAQQALIPMDEKLHKAISEAPNISHHSARKRHLQYIGKLMRNADSDAISEAYDKVMEQQHQSVRQHHQMEQWRDQLLADETALERFIRQFPHCDRQQLRQLIRAAQRDKKQAKPPASARKLFRFIRECYENT